MTSFLLLLLLLLHTPEVEACAPVSEVSEPVATAPRAHARRPAAGTEVEEAEGVEHGVTRLPRKMKSFRKVGRPPKIGQIGGFCSSWSLLVM